MRRHAVVASIVVAACLLAGCAPRTLFAWRDYDETLYAHYKDPADHEKNLARLQNIVQRNEKDGLKMPPGIYAQYGYALLEAGNSTEAVVYFEKERAVWPESAVLMEKLIHNVRRQADATSTTTPVQLAGSQTPAPSADAGGPKP